MNEKKIKENRIFKSMSSSPVIDMNVESNIPRSINQFDEAKHKHKCTCCGKGFTTQNGNFQKSNDVLFQANDGYLPWCKECTDKYTNIMTALYSNNEEIAMRDFCQRAGWNYDLTALCASMETYSGHKDRSRISHYAAKKNLNCGGRKTYFDSIKFEYLNKQEEVIQSKDEIKTKDVSVTGTAIDRWGAGLTEWDYTTLEEHYKMLKKNNPNCDNNQEIFIKSLCNLNWLQIKILRQENCDTTKYAALVKQYADTFKQTGLKTVEEKDNSNNETVGVTLATISQFTPEEFYKDKELFSDNDNIGDYYDRHICRPMKNLMFDGDVRDKEFFVSDGDIEDDD